MIGTQHCPGADQIVQVALTAGGAVRRPGNPAGDQPAHVKSGIDKPSDLRQAARLLIDTHGADARPRAAARSHELLVQGDMIGHAIWQKVLRAIDELLSGPAGG